MRKDSVQIAVWCLLLLTTLSVFIGIAHAQENPEPKPKTASQLWEDYQDASINANTGADNYNTHVRAAKEARDNLNNNKKTFSESTKSTLTDLFLNTQRR